jgi:hypothetical protein
MRIPQTLSLIEIQAAFREIQAALQPFLSGNPDFTGRRITNAGEPISAFDYARKIDVEASVEGLVQKAVQKLPSGLLSAATEIRAGAYATRGAATGHANQLFLASDRDYVAFFSNGAIWVWAGGVHRDTFANRPTPTSDETNYTYEATDTEQRFFWTGSAWDEQLAPALLPFLGLTSSFPALKRSSAILQARLADDSAYTDLEVADEAYDATTWNASLEVPTKNAVRDKVVTLFPTDPPVGTYTPTLTNLANIDASTAYLMTYMRVGSAVLVAGQVDVDPTAAGTYTQLGISLPVASNFANIFEAGGVGNTPGVASYPGTVYADASNNRAELAFTSLDGTNRQWWIFFMYRII